MEWDFIHCVTPHIGEAFCPVEEALEKYFLPSLFQGSMSKVPMLGITHLPFKQAGLEIPNPNLSAWENWMASFVVTGHLVEAFWVRK